MGKVSALISNPLEQNPKPRRNCTEDKLCFCWYWHLLNDRYALIGPRDRGGWGLLMEVVGDSVTLEVFLQKSKLSLDGGRDLELKPSIAASSAL